jgi:hypothetical protein
MVGQPELAASGTTEMPEQRPAVRLARGLGGIGIALVPAAATRRNRR